MSYLHIILYTLFIVFLIALWVRRRYRYWITRGVPGPKPKFPLGYFNERLVIDPVELELKWLKEHGKMYGVLMGIEPVLTISDVSLVKQVLIKDFHLFVNRRELQSYHEIWTKNILFLQLEDGWKRIRSITTTSFTTGRLRRLFPYFMTAIHKLENYFDNLLQKKTTDAKGVDFHVKGVMAGMALDVIAGSMFGINTQSNLESQNDREAYNAFRFFGHKFFQQGVFEVIGTAIFPRWLLRIFRVPHQFPQDAFNFFKVMSQKALQNPCSEDTLMGMLQKAYKNLDDKEAMKHGKFMTENEVIAQTMLFFVAAFETVASALSRSLYELSRNPGTQERLHSELEELFQEFPDEESQKSEKFYYKVTFEMPYLESVIKETLRMYPPLYRLERRYNGQGGKGYKLGGVVLEKDQLVEISTVAVHYDPDYWGNDSKTFSPERFMPDNKDKLVPYTWIPFGDGSRNCVGKRFGEQEMRLALAFLIHKFKFELADDTPKVIENYIGNPFLIATPYNLRVSSRR